MPFYKKKETVIQAFKLGEKGKPTPVPRWFPSPDHKDITPDGIKIHTLEGTYLAYWGDFILKDDEGEIFPCKPDYFKKNYEYVAD